MEMHLLFVLPEFDHDYLRAFESGPGNVIEISILWRLSNTHNAAWSLLNDLTLSQKLSENQTITSSGETSFRLSDFIPRNTYFVLYPGSTCFNNCLETNTWIVFDEPMDFDTADLGMRHWTYISDGVEIPLHRNIRDVQPRNGRPVYHGNEQRVMFKDPSCRV
ncbi:hypothetical protein HA402_008970 [Bradysia odoriphaga]|nr:hypothetical protein HA402_008970 [Bradysia odoriphaga]